MNSPYLQRFLILTCLFFSGVIAAQKKDLMCCSFDNSAIHGNFVEVQCPYFFNCIKNGADSISVLSDSLYLDENDSTYSKIYLNLNMTVRAAIDSGTLLLNGPFYMIHAGDTIFRGYHKMGVRDGYAKYAYDGKTITGFFNNGLLEGVAEERGYDGARTVAEYRLGKINGIQYATDTQGRITWFMEYRNGKQNGMETMFHENGLPRLTLQVKNDKVKNGTYYAYNIDGDVTKIVRYRKGKPKIEYLNPPVPAYLVR